jgi:hypothetical protein
MIYAVSSRTASSGPASAPIEPKGMCEKKKAAVFVNTSGLIGKYRSARSEHSRSFVCLQRGCSTLPKIEMRTGELYGRQSFRFRAPDSPHRTKDNLTKRTAKCGSEGPAGRGAPRSCEGQIWFLALKG